MKEELVLPTKINIMLNSFLNTLPNMMLVIDINGTITMVNEKLNSIFGYEIDELIGKKSEILISEKYRDQIASVMERIIEIANTGELIENVEVMALKKDAAVFFAEIDISPVESQEGYHFIISIKDITERKKKERKVLQAREREAKQKELEQFVYVASHDLLEPLNVMSNMVELIEEKLEEKDPKLMVYLKYMSNSSNTLSKLITELLNYSKLGTEEQMTDVDCNQILDKVKNDLGNKIESTNANIQSENLPIVYGRVNELQLLFHNLINNAIKFKKSEIHPEIFITTEKKWNRWEFKFQDNGIGIEEKYQAKIFYLFQRLFKADQSRNSGIGLAQCKKIVESHGGDIWVESKPGIGSQFHFTLYSKTNFN